MWADYREKVRKGKKNFYFSLSVRTYNSRTLALIALGSAFGHNSIFAWMTGDISLTRNSGSHIVCRGRGVCR